MPSTESPDNAASAALNPNHADNDDGSSGEDDEVLNSSFPNLNLHSRLSQMAPPQPRPAAPEILNVTRPRMSSVDSHSYHLFDLTRPLTAAEQITIEEQELAQALRDSQGNIVEDRIIYK